MKNDEQEVNPQPQSSNIESPGATAEPLADNNGHQTHEPEPESAEEASGKQTVSSRKIEANRRNARKGTGPKTTAGKKRVSRNAIKHGFFSKYLLVQHRDGKENQGEYDDFYAGIRKDFQPVGWLEGLWVEKIAVWSWRLRRLLRCETGQIDRALAAHSYEVQQSKGDDLAEPESAPWSSPEMDAMSDHLFLPGKDELDKLPGKDELDKLLRYEAMINRQLNHAISELERIQERRRGKSIVM